MPLLATKDGGTGRSLLLFSSFHRFQLCGLDTVKSESLECEQLLELVVASEGVGTGST